MDTRDNYETYPSLHGDFIDEYDDEKNDETFGDIGPLSNDWEKEHEKKKDTIELFKKQQKANTSIESSHLFFLGKDAIQEKEPDITSNTQLSSVLSFAMDDDDDDLGEEIIFKQPNKDISEAFDTSNLFLYTPEKQKKETFEVSSIFSTPPLTDLFATPTSQKDVPVQKQELTPPKKSPLFAPVSPPPKTEEEMPTEMLSANDLEKQLMESLKIQEQPTQWTHERQTIFPPQFQRPPPGMFPPAFPMQMPPPAFFPPPPGMQFRPPMPYMNEGKRTPFPNLVYMRPSDIEFVFKQQQRGLEMVDPYIDDFYFHGFVTRKIQALAFPPNAIYVSIKKREMEAEEKNKKKEEEEEELPRLFGRIPSQSIRAPRKIVDINQEEIAELTKHVELNKNENVNLFTLIENVTNILLDIEDLTLCQKQSPNLFKNANLQEKLDATCKEFLSSIKIKENNIRQEEGENFILRLFDKPKGIKLVAKALRILPGPYSIPILDACLQQWKALFSKIAIVENAQILQKLFVDSMCMSMNQYTLEQLMERLMLFLEMDPVIFAKSSEGTQLFLACLRRGDEILQGKQNIQWDYLKNSFFEKLRSVTYDTKF